MGGLQEEEAELNRIRVELPYLTNALLSGRAYENGTTVEEETRRELMRLEVEALRTALRPPLSENLQKLLTVLVDADDGFVPLSTLAARAELHRERSVINTLAHLNRKVEGNVYLTWSSFLLGNDEIGYRLPDHLREVAREALKANKR